MTDGERFAMEAERLIRRIRNPGKKAYAKRYIEFMLRPAPAAGDPEPDRSAALSYMAAQAVRQQLYEAARAANFRRD